MRAAKRRSRYRKSPANKLWLAGLVLASIALVVLSKSDAVISRFIVENTSDLTAPILDGLSEPIGQMRAAVSSAGSYSYLVDEVARLRKENDRLRSLQGKIEQLGDKVRRYEEMLNAASIHEPNFKTARVIGDTGSPFIKTVLINAGRAGGVGKDQPVVDSRGLVGRTISSGTNASRVLLLTDLNSRVPVRVQPDGYRAVLAGNNTNWPSLEFLPIGSRLRAGDRIVTSGHGGLFPPGIPVGEVEANVDGGLVIRLSAPIDYLEYVRVLEPSPEVVPEGSDDADPETPVADSKGGDSPTQAAGADSGSNRNATQRRSTQGRGTAARTASTAPPRATPEPNPPAGRAVLPREDSQRGFGR